MIFHDKVFSFVTIWKSFCFLSKIVGNNCGRLDPPPLPLTFFLYTMMCCWIIHMCWSFCNDPPSPVGDFTIVVHVCILWFFMAWQQLMFFMFIMLLYNVALWWKIKAKKISSMLINLWTCSRFVSNEEKDELFKLPLMLLLWEGWQHNYYECWSCIPCPTFALNIVLLTFTTLSTS